MRKFYLSSTLVLLAIFFGNVSYTQDFSNKGKDFWVGYGYHAVMTGNNAQEMVLYFAADVNSNVTVTIPALGYTANYFVAAGTVVTSSPIPKINPQDARLLTEGISNNGIHITSDKAIVAYAHIYNQSVSGATILFPTNTLGTQYYSINFENLSNSANANCWFYVLATDTGTTNVKITPSANTTGGWIAGNTYNISLTQGQIYNVMGTYSGNSGVDLTGSKIEAASGSSGCNRIAVFSGSGRINIACGSGPTTASSDNYMVQAVPKAAWGTKYLTSPTSTLPNNFFRICVSHPAANVLLNGAPIGLPLQNGFYYEISPSSSPLLIESDSVITVAQYITSQGLCGNGSPGDPEVIYLSPVQQSINKVLWNATPNFAISQHYYNVIISNKGTALSSFMLDGVPVPVGAFTVHPQESNYSYLSQSVTSGQHVIQSDSGFNAMAYGFGNFESYGYNAGTNVKDLYQQILLNTDYGIEPTPTICSGTPFKFKVSLPYCADSIQWNLSNLPGPPAQPPTQIYASCGAADSTTVVNGKTIYWYSLPSTYVFTAVGTYPVTIFVYAPNAGSCGNVQDIDFDLEVTPAPSPGFSYVAGACAAEPVQFTETTPQTPKPTYSWWWSFGDPASGAANTSTIRNPTHTFTGPGTYTVRYAAITTPGCLTDTISQQVTINPLPAATVAGNATACLNGTQPVITFTGTPGAGPYTFYYHINAGGPLTATTAGTTATVNASTAVAGTFTYTLDSVRVTGSALCVSIVTGQQVTINVVADATVSLTSGAATANQTVCVNAPISNITYSIGGSGTGASITAGSLPAGVTGNFAGGVFTISGTPTATGTFNYTVGSAGPCANPTLSGTITVTPDASIALSSAAGTNAQTVCVNTAVTNITYSVTGGGTGASITAGALPAGVTGSYSGGVFTITGTPTATGVFNYTVTTTGPCVNASQSGTITVNANSTLNLTSAAGTNNQSVCVNIPITNITYAVGGTGTGASITAGGLPAGVTGSFAGGVFTISGAPTVGGTFNYTVGTTGPCNNPTLSGTITVTPDPSLTLSSAAGTNNQTVCINTAITNLTYSVGGGGTGASITAGSLPAGVTGSFAAGVFTITGTPTATGTFNFTVSTTGSCVNASQNGSITVNPVHAVSLTSAAATTNQTLCINTAITSITYNLSGGATGATVTGLPTGVTATVAGNTITISGTPTTTAGSPFNYSITTTGNSCLTASANGTITVNADHAITLSSAASTTNQTVCINTSLTAITYTLSGGATGATVTGLPAGVTSSIAGNTLTISGTPTTTVGSPFNYSINTTGNSCVIASASGSITVNPVHAVSLTSAASTTNQTLCVNTAITSITYNLSGGATGATVTGLPAGVTASIVGNTITISGTPTTSAGSPFNYSIATSGNSCLTASANGTITVNADHAITLSSAAGTANQTVCINTSLTAITYTLSGGATGATVTGLPAGVTSSIAGNTLTISGNPTTTVGSPFNYSINTTGNSCVIASASGSITVNPVHAVSLTSAASTTNQTVCVNNAITSITYNLSGGATGATVTGLPAGVTASVVGNTITISGTPTTSAGSPFNYGITTSGNSCLTASANGTITVNADHSIALSSAASTTSQTVCVNTSLTTITYTLGGGATGATVTGLPAGVTSSVAGNTLTISGNPTTTAGSPFNYSITTTGNSCVTATASGSITVNPVHAISLTSAAATTNQTLCINTAITSITYTLSGGATNATVTGLPAGVSASVAGNTLTISGTPTTTAGSPFNFSITTTGNSCLTASANGTLTVNPDHSINLSSAAGTNSQTVCINTAITAITYTFAGGATGVTVTGLPAGVTSSVAGTTVTISGTPTTAAGSPFNYSITTTGNACVTASASGSITVTPAQLLTLSSAASTSNQAVCINTALTTITYTLGGGATNATVTGLPAGVTSTLSGSTLTISGSPSTTGGSPFSYSISTSGNSCTPASASGTITVNPDHAITLSSASSTTSQTVCSDRPITAITYALSGGANGATVTGLPPGVTSSVSGNVLTISGSPTTIAGSPFNYSISTTGNGCNTASANGSISVLLTPTVQFNPVAGICADVAPFNLSGLPAGGTFSGTGVNAGGLFTPSVAGAGNHAIRYTYVAANGCSNFAEQIVPVYPLPVVDAGPDKGLIEGGQVTLTPNVTASFNITYLWTPPQYLSNPAIRNPVVSNIPSDQVYQLTVTSDNGCSASDFVNVKLLKKIEVPNIFSPNGDGVHDTWVIPYLDSYPGNTVEVFNRYGQRIFYSEGYGKPWDGTVNGKQVPVGTYYYIITPKNGRLPMAGYVDIIR